MRIHLTTTLGIATGLALACNSAYGQFAYANRDVLLTFHQTGSPDLIVNAGSVSSFVNLALSSPGSTISISQYNATQISTAFSSLSGVSWSAMSAVPSGTGDASAPDNTVWLTNPRFDINVQTTPFQQKTASTQSSWRSKVLSVAGVNSTVGAIGYSAGTALDPVSNTSTALIIPSDSPSSYSQIAGLTGNLGGTFGQGTIENTTPSGFTGVTRSDFYQLKPGSGNGQYLGYFEFGANGKASFTSVPEPGTWALMTLGGVALLRRRLTGVFTKQS